MRRIAVLPALAAALAVAGCAAGTLAPGAGDAPSDAPSSSVATPSATPAPEPSPSPSASEEPSSGNRFDDVDLAAALVPIPATFGEPERWGAWTTTVREAMVPGIDPATFATVPECQASLDAVVAIAPVEVVVGGYPYDGVQVTWILAARMASSEEAAAYLAALEAAADACLDVQGSAVEGGVTAVRGPLGPSAAIESAGMTLAAVGYEGSFHHTGYVLSAQDELIVATTSGMDVQGWDAEAVAQIQAQIAAFEAAAQ